MTSKTATLPKSGVLGDTRRTVAPIGQAPPMAVAQSAPQAMPVLESVKIDNVVHSFVSVGDSAWAFLDRVVRPSDQIDPVVNLPPGGGPARPAPLFRQAEFWAQGVNAGLEFRY